MDERISRGSRHLRALWGADSPAYGVWSNTADPVVNELLGSIGFDYVCVDLQHGFATAVDLPGVLGGLRQGGAAPLVRVPWNEPAAIMRALDLGAAGVIVPMVNSAADAERAVAACRYAPLGERSWGPTWADTRPQAAWTPGGANEDVLCVVMVETRRALDSLDEILAVPGVDAVYIGPYDLALSCGFGQRTYREDPAVDALLASIVDACRQAGVVSGLHCTNSPEMAVEWAGRGVRMLTAVTDLTLLRSAALDALSRTR